MATWSDAFSDNTDHDLELLINENSVDETANTSSVTGVLRINPPSNSVSWNGYSSQNSYSFTFNGTTHTGNFTYDFRTDRSVKVLKTVTSTIAHSADGTKTVTGYGSATTGSIGNASISSKSLTLTDIARPPSAPGSAPTLSRSSNGLTLTVTSATASSAVTPSDYEARYQASGASTWTTVSLGTDKTGTVTVGSSTNSYLVETRAVSSEGNGAWSSTSTIVGLPTAPATITTDRNGRNVTVTAGTSTGTGITGYSVQYSTDSGSTWSSAQAMTSQVYTYTNLTPALTYLFRVYATNSIGSSATTNSAEVFVPAGGKRWTGSAWTAASIGRRWNGSAWVDLTVAKRWNGSAWTDLS